MRSIPFCHLILSRCNREYQQEEQEQERKEQRKNSGYERKERVVIVGR